LLQAVAVVVAPVAVLLVVAVVVQVVSYITARSPYLETFRGVLVLAELLGETASTDEEEMVLTPRSVL
jgi:hypothetical protein